MTVRDPKQSEKEYFSRLGAGDWDRLKPFSPPGDDTLEESAHLIQDFAAALKTLRPTPADLILDLGSGACWCSDWLERLNRRAVAVDISLDMLRLGRTRLPRPDRARLVVGDMEHLPFITGAFDKAFCLSAAHHVPSIEKALEEICRVLAPDGSALFSEPGKGHSRKPGSISAMRDFGVLEQDILIPAFMEACYRAGFIDVRLKPMSYVIPGFDLTLDQWKSWQRLSARKRPWRATEKMWRAFIEFLGLRKKDQLFEEAFAMNLVRLLKGSMEDHPIIVASKAPLTRVERAEYAAQMEVLEAPASTSAGQSVSLAVALTNAGNSGWPATGTDSGYVRVGVQLLDVDKRLIDRDYHREPLAHDVGPRQELIVRVTCRAPAMAGTYHLKLDLVMEGVTWFEPRGSQTAICRLSVSQ